MASDTQYLEIRTVEDVTPEIIEMAWSYVEGFYLTRPVDWEDVFDRMERSELKDGRSPDFGPQQGAAAMRHVQKVVRQMRREATE